MTLVRDVPFLWIKEELKEQKRKLTTAEKAVQFKSIEAYQKYMRMRQELVSVCQKYQ